MSQEKIQLTAQEQQWISEQRITRLTDDQEVLIYPMGAERYLSSVLFAQQQSPYPLKKDIEGKKLLIIPGYGNSAFLFAQAGAKSITVYDKDPVTIAWVKAFKKYYHYREYNAQDKPYPSVGELLTALTCWYPPLIKLPYGSIQNTLKWVLSPKSLRKTYLRYLLSLVRDALQTQSSEDFEWEKDIRFFAGELSHLCNNKQPQLFDTAFVPYLLGVRNGIENEQDIVNFIKKIAQVVPEGPILVTPALGSKEFHFIGQRYFETTKYQSLWEIPGLEPYFVSCDPYWFKTQGLAIFRNRSK